MTENPVKRQAPLRPQFPRDIEGIPGRRVDPRPVIAAIHLEPDMQAAAGQRLRRVEIVENHAERPAVLRDALHLRNVGRIERECPRQLREAAARERRRFEQRGYRDALCPQRQLAAAQLETLVRLDVGTEGDVETPGSLGHGLQVPLHHVAIEQQCWSVDVDHRSRRRRNVAGERLAIDAAARYLHTFHALDSSRAADEVRRGPARQRDEEENRPNHGVDEAEHQRRYDQRAGACERDPRQQFVGDPQPECRDQEPDKEASHGWEDNRCARPATKRAVMPGLACTPSLESSRIAPPKESRPDQASDTPANGPRSAGQPLTMACSGCPNQVAETVSARGARKTMCPRNRHSRPTIAVVVSSRMSWIRKRSLIPGAAGNVSVSPRATTQWPA